MIDIEKFIYALKSTWVKRLWNNDSAQWVKILDYRVLLRDKLVLLGPSWHKTLNNKVTNPFWKDILLSWSKINENIPLKTLKILLQTHSGTISKSALNLSSSQIGTRLEFSAQQTSWIVKEFFQKSL